MISEIGPKKLSWSRQLSGFICFEFGPDRFPVIGTEVFTGNLAAGGDFNGRTPLDRNGTLSGFPLADQNGRNPEFFSETQGGRVRLREKGIEVHGAYTSETRMFRQ